ncbi:hypothetical protein QPK87_10115 [Kamptonema cortianum]|nr:hypothetical protein [Kamptonema cortianum]
MKLNLLPSDVSKQGMAATAWVGAILLAVAGIASAVVMMTMSSAQLADAKQAAQGPNKAAADALATAKLAEDQIAKATIIDRSLKLSQAMDAHNRKYTDLYKDVMRYVPTYYRLTGMQAVPNGPESCTVTLTGQLETFRQYADLAISLWKVPDALNVQRAGYAVNLPRVPNLSETDQLGAPIRPSEAPLPSDSLERLDELIARAASEPTGYRNVGNFGTPGQDTRGALPGWSTVTMTLVLGRNIQTPDPRATLGGGGGAGAGAAPAGGFGGVQTRQR